MSTVGCAHLSEVDAPRRLDAWSWSADSSGWHFAFGSTATPRMFLPRDANGFGYWQQDSLALVFYGPAFAFVDTLRPASAYTPLVGSKPLLMDGAHGTTQLVVVEDTMRVILPDGKTLSFARRTSKVSLLGPFDGAIQLELPIASPTGFGAFDQPFQVGAWRMLRSPLYGLFVWYGPEANYAVRLRPDQHQWLWRTPNLRPSVRASHVAHTIFANGTVVEGTLDFTLRPWEDIPTFGYRTVFTAARFEMAQGEQATVVERTPDALVIKAPDGACWAFNLEAPLLEYTSPNGVIRQLPVLPGVRR